jgi:hypothetical protein
VPREVGFPDSNHLAASPIPFLVAFSPPAILVLGNIGGGRPFINGKSMVEIVKQTVAIFYQLCNFDLS